MPSASLLGVRRARLMVLALLASAILGSSGCVSAGMAAAGPLVSSLVAIADRKVERTLPADPDSAWDVTLDALARLGVRVVERDRSGESWTLTGTGEAVTVHGALERVTAGMSRLSLRVEAGGLLPDKRTAEEILNQVIASLSARSAAQVEARSAQASAEQMAALRREVERLGAKLQENTVLGAQQQSGETVSLSTAMIEDRVVVVPASVGVPILTGPAGASLSLWPKPAIPIAHRPGQADAPMRVQKQESTAELVRRLLPAPLQPADVLAPAEGLAVPTNNR